MRQAERAGGIEAQGLFGGLRLDVRPVEALTRAIIAMPDEV
jgi:hypothetical protein